MTRKDTWIAFSPANLSKESQSTPRIFAEKLKITPSKRIVWNEQIQNRFVVVLEKLGKNSVPSVILNHMNVEGLTRDQVSSHLQKYRSKLKKQTTPLITPTCSAPPTNKLKISFLIN